MSNYFSNHSQPRLFTNAAASQAPTSSTTTTTVTPPGQRPRLSSKHFSTSVSGTSPLERSKSREQLASDGVSSLKSASSLHPLRHTWIYFFRQQRAPGNKITNYEEGIKKISSFGSVESFWSLWTHLSPPSTIQPTTDYLLFHSGVRRPVWEDPLNLSGGKWIIRLKKGVADRIWEDLVLAIIGDQFDDCRESPSDRNDSKSAGDDDGSASEWPEICGCTISVRQSEDIVSIWNKTEGDMKLREKIRNTIRRVLNLPPATIMEYKSNNDSMHDRSSFRNSAIDKTPLS